MVNKAKKILTLLYTFLAEQRRSIGCSSAIYSIEDPLELLHADIADIRFVAKFAVDPKYGLLIGNLFTSKIYMYSIKNRRPLAKKLALFYKDMSKKKEMDENTKRQKIRKKQNKKTEQEIREFKKLLLKTKNLDKKFKKK